MLIWDSPPRKRSDYQAMYFSGHITGLSGTVMHLISTKGENAGFCLSNAIHAKDNAEQQGRVELKKKHRESHKSPLLNNALF